MHVQSRNRGLTLIEILIVVIVIAVIASIGISAFIGQRSKREIQTIADGIVMTLGRAKADALSGKNGSSFGVYFSSTTYSYFTGPIYNASDTSATYTSISSQYVITDTVPGSTSIVFSRLTGFPVATGTVTVTDSTDSSNKKIISIGTNGDISVIQ